MKNAQLTHTLEAPEPQSEGSVQGDARRAARKLHPVLLMWLGANPALFAEQPDRGSDLVQHAATHPDVVKIRNSFPQMSLETATKMAWLVWRARQITFWTRNLSKDTYARSSDSAIPVLVHKGVDTVTWAEAIEHADLREESDTHNLAMERRARYYAGVEAQRENEEAIALTIGAVDLRKPAQGLEDLAETDRLTAQKSGEVTDISRDDADAKMQRQATAKATRVTEEKMAAKTAVPPTRRSKHVVQGVVQRITAKVNAGLARKAKK